MSVLIWTIAAAIVCGLVVLAATWKAMGVLFTMLFCCLATFVVSTTTRSSEMEMTFSDATPSGRIPLILTTCGIFTLAVMITHRLQRWTADRKRESIEQYMRAHARQRRIQEQPQPAPTNNLPRPRLEMFADLAKRAGCHSYMSRTGCLVIEPPVPARVVTWHQVQPTPRPAQPMQQTRPEPTRPTVPPNTAPDGYVFQQLVRDFHASKRLPAGYSSDTRPYAMPSNLVLTGGTA